MKNAKTTTNSAAKTTRTTAKAKTATNEPAKTEVSKHRTTVGTSNNKSNKAIRWEDLPKDAWVLRNQRYTYHGGKFLPYTSVQNKEVLETLGIPYEVSTLRGNDVLSFWDPEVPIEHENHTAPLYYQGSDSKYHYAKSYTGIVISEKCLKAAAVLRQKLEPEFKKYSEYCHAKKILNGHLSGVSMDSRTSSPIINWNGSDIRVFSFAIGSNDCIQVFFDLGTIKANEYNYLILTVPEKFQQYRQNIIGKERSRIDFWAAQIGLKNIYVK